jgi:hypothetical protein
MGNLALLNSKKNWKSILERDDLKIESRRIANPAEQIG